MKKPLLLLLCVFLIFSCVENKVKILEEKQEIIDPLENEIVEIEDKLERLNNDQKELEKFAREKFLNEEDEDIIIIREQEDE